MKVSGTISAIEMYQQSLDAFQEMVHSAKSGTLEEIYTERFMPYITGQYMTTVKSLKTGDPAAAVMKRRVKETFEDSIKKIEYTDSLTHQSTGTVLGSKTFDIEEDFAGDLKFVPGSIESYHNDSYSGAQIRLLQACCEEASLKGIESIPLKSVMSAVKFHTMMGFRPNESFKREVRCVDDVNEAIKEDIKKLHFEPCNVEEIPIRPILSKRDDKYFFDVNRTYYYTAMQYCNELLSRFNKRNLKLKDLFTGDVVNMTLEGKEYDDWMRRIRGFEILPESKIRR